MPSDEVKDAVGAAPDRETLEQRIARLRGVVQTPTDREIAARMLREAEAALAEQRQAALKEEAAARVLAIKRAHGSLAAESAEDDDRLVAAAQVYKERMAQLNARFYRLWALQLEAEALVEAFGLDAVTLAPVITPYLRPKLGEALLIVSEARFCECRPLPATDFRTGRRTLHEIAESEGYALIQRKTV